MPQSDLLSMVMTLMWNIPYLLVYFVGIVMAIVRWRRHPGVSQLALVAFGLLLMVHMIWSTFPFWRLVLRREVFDVPFLYGGMRLVTLCLAVLAYGLLIGAIFGWRSSSNPYMVEGSRHTGKPSL